MLGLLLNYVTFQGISEKYVHLQPIIIDCHGQPADKHIMQ